MVAPVRGADADRGKDGAPGRQAELGQALYLNATAGPLG
jgi:hypothetical protein